MNTYRLSVSVVVVLVLNVALFAQVREDWVILYDGPGGVDDESTALTLDNQGNLYVAGSSNGLTSRSDLRIAKYSPEGTLLWAAVKSNWGYAYALAVDEDNSVYVSGEYTVKYDAEGRELWIASDNVSASALALDGEGNVCATGRGGTVKYTPAGEKLWLNDLAGGSLVVDEENNIYIAGFADGSCYCECYVVRKFDADGNEMWAEITEGETFVPPWLTTDSEGAVYLSGSRHVSDGEILDVTVKYDASGNELWERDSFAVVAADDSGHVYAYRAGASSGWEIVKYDMDANEIWAAGTGGVLSYYVADGEGYVYAADDDGSETTGRDFVIAKYGSEGELWSIRYDGPHHLDDWLKALVVDDEGNVYVTGSSESKNGELDWATVKYVQGSFDDVVLLRGDCNGDSEVNIADANCALDWLFAGAPEPGCLASLNTNRDERVDITDAVYLLNFLFGGGPAPAAPFPDCGPSMLMADTELGCANPPGCEG